MIKSAYEAMAAGYEYLMKDVNYKSWTEYVVGVVEKYKSGNKGADIACGSGIFTAALTRAGNEMTGVDISPAMLMEAKNKNPAIQLYCRICLV